MAYYRNGKEVKVEVRKEGRSWGIFAGVAKLRGFRSELAANKELCENKKLYEYYMNSLSVCAQNTPFKIINA